MPSGIGGPQSRHLPGHPLTIPDPAGIDRGARPYGRFFDAFRAWHELWMPLAMWRVM